MLNHKMLAVMVGACLVPVIVTGQEISGEKAELSYMMGYNVGQRMKQIGVTDVVEEAFMQGARQAMEGTDSALSAEQVQRATAAMTALQEQAAEQQRLELAAASDENRTQGEAFLKENGARDGVIATDSGLQYEVIEMGSGDKPAATDTVTVHYRGTLLDGTEFDSSYSRGQPATFALNRVISGWTEGLQLMPAGSKFRFYIPSDLAYGGRSTGNIGPNSTLIFDVELISIGE